MRRRERTGPAETPKQGETRRARPRLPGGWFPWVGLLAGAIVGIPWITRLASSPSLVQPLNPELLDPDLAIMIREHLNAVRQAPESASAWAELGIVYEANFLWIEARDCYLRATDLDPTEPLWPFHRVLMSHEAGELDLAKAQLRKVVEFFPEFRPALYALGKFVMDEGNFQEALSRFARVVELDPYLPEGHAALADLYLRMGEPARALKSIDRALGLFPDLQGAHYLRGMALSRLGRENEAQVVLAESSAPASPGLRDEWKERLPVYFVQVDRQLNAATDYLEHGRTAQAIEILEAALKRHPEDPRVGGILGTAYLRDARPDWGVEMLEAAAEKFPDDFSARVNLATCYLMLRRAPDALREADRAIEKAPDDARGYLVRSRTLRSMGRLDEAWSTALEAWNRNPKDAGIIAEMMQLAELRGDTQRLPEPPQGAPGATRDD